MDGGTPSESPTRPKRKGAADELAPAEAVSDWKALYPEAFIAIEYRPDAAEAWRQISKLPDSFKEKFLAQLNDDPKSDVSVIVASVETDRERERNPFEDPTLNEAHAEALILGEAAANEFKRVANTLGETVNLSELLGIIFSKYAIERGTIGGRDYFIKFNREFVIKTDDGNFKAFRNQVAATTALGIPNFAKKTIKFHNTN